MGGLSPTVARVVHHEARHQAAMSDPLPAEAVARAAASKKAARAASCFSSAECVFAPCPRPAALCHRPDALLMPTRARRLAGGLAFGRASPADLWVAAMPYDQSGGLGDHVERVRHLVRGPSPCSSRRTMSAQPTGLPDSSHVAAACRGVAAAANPTGPPRAREPIGRCRAIASPGRGIAAPAVPLAAAIPGRAAIPWVGPKVHVR